MEQPRHIGSTLSPVVALGIDTGNWQAKTNRRGQWFSSWTWPNLAHIGKAWSSCRMPFLAVHSVSGAPPWLPAAPPRALRFARRGARVSGGPPEGQRRCGHPGANFVGSGSGRAPEAWAARWGESPSRAGRSGLQAFRAARHWAGPDGVRGGAEAWAGRRAGQPRPAPPF